MTIEKAVKLLLAEYARATTLDFVRKPLSYALYKVWKEADKKEAKRDAEIH